ncbi:MAG: hypothetical protein AAF411_22435, partial [Myxococcota bacterium]
VGYYDTEGQRLVIRDDIMALLIGRPTAQETVLARLTLVHELVHALQDQRLGIGETYEAEHDSDDAGVLRCIAEGDAMLAMLLHAAGPPAVAAALAQPVDLATIGDGAAGGEALQEAPAILRIPLVAPYILGLRLVAQTYQAGGWRAVDGLFRQPPGSMADVLHGDVAEEPIAPDALPDLPGFERDGDDALGELELAVYLGQRTPRAIHEAAAEGWRGDRLGVYQREGEVALVWWITFDDASNAREAEAIAGSLGGDVAREGRHLAIVRQAPPEALPELRSHFQAFAQGRAVRP